MEEMPGGSNSGGGSGSNQPAQSEGDYVLDADGNHLSVDKSKWKYDTSEAVRLGRKGYWANGDLITNSDRQGFFSMTIDKDAAKYFVAAGIYPQSVYDEMYGN